MKFTQSRLNMDQIDKIFREAQTQDDYVLGLFKQVIPCWDDVERVAGYPLVSEKTNKYIFKWAMKWDAEHKTGTVQGGAWMNYGFGTDQKGIVPDWIVDFSAIDVVMKKDGI